MSDREANARRLQIGMWYRLDEEHWNLHGGRPINGMEISQFEREQDLFAAADFCRARSLSLGVHAPVLAKKKYALPKLTPLLEAERLEAQAAIREDVALASRFGADYVLFHYPFPPIFSAEKDERYLRGLPRFERYDAWQMNPEMFGRLSGELFRFLEELQAHYRQRIVLEYDFFGDYENIVTEMFMRHREIRLVVDMQRLDCHRRAFPRFDPYTWLETVAPSVYLVHYSNVRYDEGKFRRHLPVLPEQDADPAYGDAYGYLQFLSRRNDAFHVTFEHDPKLVGRQELQSCYETVSRLLA